MALNSKIKPEETQVQDDTILLELTMYNNFTIGETTYEKGKPYRFTQKVALRLLAEQDMGRPVWKQFVAPVEARAPKAVVVEDRTKIEIPQEIEPDPAASNSGSTKRIEIGDESELADILNKDEVTV
jgi:hypothetical protein